MKPTNPLFFKIDEMLLDDPEHFLTTQEILEAYSGKAFKKTPRETDTISNSEYINQFRDVIKMIKSHLKKHGLKLDYKNGKDITKGFRYPQGVEDPMWRKKTDHKQMRSDQINRLIDASIGLFPTSWLADILAGAQSLAADENKCIIFDQNPHVAHIQWVPTFFDAIEKQKVVKFEYNPKYGEKVFELLFHPYYLKEYNQRWFVFGYATDIEGNPSQYTNCPIDRIVSDVTISDDVIYIPPKKKNFASTYFKDIVGVNRPKNKKPKVIMIATNDALTHGRIMTKPIHDRSQRELRVYNKALGQRGIITFKVIPNNELDTLLMSYGAGIEVLEPNDYREDFMKKVKALKDLYFRQEDVDLEA